MPSSELDEAQEPVRPRRRGIYVLPNAVTLAALFAGFYGIVMAMSGRFELAAIGIFCAAILDSLDGRIARMAERRLKIDPSLLLVLPMAADAVGLDEGSDPLLEGLLGGGLKRGEIPITPRLRGGSPREERQESEKSPDRVKTAWKFRDSHGEPRQA